jgi:hypothetical protein
LISTVYTSMLQSWAYQNAEAYLIALPDVMDHVVIATNFVHNGLRCVRHIQTLAITNRRAVQTTSGFTSMTGNG